MSNVSIVTIDSKKHPAPFLSRIQREILLQDEFECRVYAGLFRCFERAPVQNKLPFLWLAARFAAERIEARRTQAIDDLRAVAADSGLVRLLGDTAVQDALGVEFGGGR